MYYPGKDIGDDNLRAVATTHGNLDKLKQKAFIAEYEILRNMEIPTSQFQLEINKLLRKYGDTCAPGPRARLQK